MSKIGQKCLSYNLPCTSCAQLSRDGNSRLRTRHPIPEMYDNIESETAWQRLNTLCQEVLMFFLLKTPISLTIKYLIYKHTSIFPDRFNLTLWLPLKARARTLQLYGLVYSLGMSLRARWEMWAYVGTASSLWLRSAWLITSSVTSHKPIEPSREPRMMKG